MGCSLGKQSVFIIMDLKEGGILHRLVRENGTPRGLLGFTCLLNCKEPSEPLGLLSRHPPPMLQDPDANMRRDVHQEGLGRR